MARLSPYMAQLGSRAVSSRAVAALAVRTVAGGVTLRFFLRTSKIRQRHNLLPLADIA